MLPFTSIFPVVDNICGFEPKDGFPPFNSILLEEGPTFKEPIFWLFPTFIVLFLFGGLIILTQGTAVAPFIYTIF